MTKKLTAVFYCFTVFVFGYFDRHIPLKLRGEVIKGAPDDAPTTTINLTCENPDQPEIVTSTGLHDIWLRRLVLSKQEIIVFLQQVSQISGFRDLMTNPS